MNFKEFVELGKEKAYDIAIDYNYKPVEYRAKYSFEDYLEELQLSLSFIISQSLLKLISIKSVMPSNHLILCPPLLLLPSVFPIIRVFSNESFLPIRWSKYWSFSFSISPFSEYSGLISFRIDRLDQLGNER